MGPLKSIPEEFMPEECSVPYPCLDLTSFVMIYLLNKIATLIDRSVVTVLTNALTKPKSGYNYFEIHNTQILL